MTNTAKSRSTMSYPLTLYPYHPGSFQNTIIGMGLSPLENRQVKRTFYPGDQMHLIHGSGIPDMHRDGNRVMCSPP